MTTLYDFCEGTLVEVAGLSTNKDLNGERGAVICAQADRLVVRLPSGDIALKPVNCKIVGGKRKLQEGKDETSEPPSQSQQQQQQQSATTSPPPPGQPQQQDIIGAAMLLNSLKSPGISQVLNNPVLQLLSMQLLKQQQQQQRSATPPPPPPPAAEDPAKPPGCCLLVVLRGSTSEPSADDIFWTFSQFGIVEKISIFYKDTNLQALLQYSTPEDALRAMGYLNGRIMYNAELAIMLSSHLQLTFPRADHRNRDFTSINNTIKKTPDDQRSAVCSANTWPVKSFLWGKNIGDGWLEPKQDPAYQGKIPAPSANNAVGRVGDCVLISGLPANMTATELWGLVGIYGKLIAVKILQKRPDCALVQYTDTYAANNAINALDSCALGEARLKVKQSKHANATNWRGANSGLEHFMCTSAERAIPESYPISPPPSKCATCNVPKDLISATKEELVEHLKSLFAPLTATVSGQTESSITFAFDSIEDSVDAICKVNGKETTFKDTIFKMKMCFW
eukprot:TRINITY_DN12761_c0_g1_i1.p1 TRINITY_DN12761_c0_g1~~TRINITY_DN12761_c0_g1_i1.p1  ORF type:complete len:525 (+),score=68.31 TRINITY_DN12761_c0_g1_i1:53-1576(+)